MVHCGPKRNCPQAAIFVTANIEAAAVDILRELSVFILALLKYAVGFPFMSTLVLNVTVHDPVTAFAALPRLPILVQPVRLQPFIVQLVRLLLA